jgi:hypothetical protein
LFRNLGWLRHVILLLHSGIDQEDGGSKPYGKCPAQNRAGEVAQVTGHLPSKYDALSSNPTTAAKNKNKI